MLLVHSYKTNSLAVLFFLIMDSLNIGNRSKTLALTSLTLTLTSSI